MSLELVNDIDERTMGVKVPIEIDNEDSEPFEYQPYIMWNLKVISCISAPKKVSSYRAYKCLVKVANGGDFIVRINTNDFHQSFKKVHESIVNQTHGVLVLRRPIENTMWTSFVPKLLLEFQDDIYHQRPACISGLACNYLEEKALENGGVLELKHAEIVYNDIVYDGLGRVKEEPIHTIVPEAYPHKKLTVTPHTPSGIPKTFSASIHAQFF